MQIRGRLDKRRWPSGRPASAKRGPSKPTQKFAGAIGDLKHSAVSMRAGRRSLWLRRTSAPVGFPGARSIHQRERNDKSQMIGSEARKNPHFADREVRCVENVI